MCVALLASRRTNQLVGVTGLEGRTHTTRGRGGPGRLNFIFFFVGCVCVCEGKSHSYGPQPSAQSATSPLNETISECKHVKNFVKTHFCFFPTLPQGQSIDAPIIKKMSPNIAFTKFPGRGFLPFIIIFIKQPHIFLRYLFGKGVGGEDYKFWVLLGLG